MKRAKIAFVSQLDSTNDWLKSCLEKNDDCVPFQGVMAGYQLAGRGRAGRVWHGNKPDDHTKENHGDYDGNLYLSLALLPPKDKQKDIAQITMLASIALHDCLCQFINQDGFVEDLRLKWPNDCMLKGRKIAGILAETCQDKHQKLWVVLGTGVNITHSPTLSHNRYHSTSLTQMGLLPEINKKGLKKIAVHYQQRLHQLWQIWCDEGFVSIKPLWLEKAQTIGSKASLNFHNGEASGFFMGIGDDGALLFCPNEDDEAQPNLDPSSWMRLYSADLEI